MSFWNWNKKSTKLWVGAVFSLCLIFGSFSLYKYSEKKNNYGKFQFRKIASFSSDLDYYLAVDRFHYYVSEYTNHMIGRVPDSVIDGLKTLSVQQIVDHGYSEGVLSQAENYDGIIYDYLKENVSDFNTPKEDLAWNYNFFKRKLNQAFTTKTKTMISGTKTDFEVAPVEGTDFKIKSALNIEEQTLDAEMYISNRTTRAVFWEAIENDREINLHIGDTRDFLKDLKAQNAEIIEEVLPFASNYNKIYLTKYPDGSTKYAITNIGGAERMLHLAQQISLSNFSGKKLQNKVQIIGDVASYHGEISDQLIKLFSNIDQPDRIIIGQQGAIENHFSYFQKIKTLTNLYKADEEMFLKSFDDKELKKLLPIIKDLDPEETLDFFSNKKVVENAHKKFEKHLKASPALVADGFKEFNFSNSIFRVSDFVFDNDNGKSIRWRVASNMWGDEVAPLLTALKATNQTNVTYIGTAGAFAGKGYKTGDLVSPSYVDVDGKTIALSGAKYDVPLAKNKGIVTHVYSPFQETKAWLEEYMPKADFVEIETSYVASAFEDTADQLKIYLMISDIVGSETETLASNSSSKRAKGLAKLINSMYREDGASLPIASKDLNESKLQIIRTHALEAFENKGRTFVNKIIAEAMERDITTKEGIIQLESEFDAFSDNFFMKKVEQTGDTLSQVLRAIESEDHLPSIAISRNFVDGKWSPKTDNFKVLILTESEKAEEQYRKILERFEDNVDGISKWSGIEIHRGQPPTDFVYHDTSSAILDGDYLTKLYAESAFQQHGLSYEVSRTGKLKYEFYPTKKSIPTCKQGADLCSLAFFSPDDLTKKKMQAASEKLDAKQQLKQLKSTIESLQYNQEGHGLPTTVKITQVDSLPDGDLAQIIPEFNDNKGLIVNMKMTSEGMRNPLVIAEEHHHLKQIFGLNHNAKFKHPSLWVETTLNAQAGSTKSKIVLAEMEVNAMETLKGELGEGSGTGDIHEFFRARLEHSQDMLSDLTKVERKQKRDKNKITKNWKAALKKMEAEDLKLDDYIAANNRKKVRELIETFMPWEDMEPVEISVWQKWLDDIETPASEIKDPFITFRGVADDLVKTGDDGNPFLMSSMLTKNQGSYTRRLRSLRTYHKKLADRMNYSTDIGSDLYNLNETFYGHALEPVGSPYLSFSNIDIAENFSADQGKWSMIAIKTSKQNALHNVASIYAEDEMLIPLIIFPDQVVHYERMEDMYEQGLNQFELSREFGKRAHEKISKIPNATVQDVQLDKVAEAKVWWNQIQPNNLKNVSSDRCVQALSVILGI